MLLYFQVEIQVAKAASLSLTPQRICYARFAHATEPRNHRTPLRLLLKLILDSSQHVVCTVASRPVKLSGEWPGFDEFHKTYIPQRGI